MKFDPVSYAMGQQAGGSGGESLPNIDNIAYGNDPTLPNRGKTNPSFYEAIADAINEEMAAGGISVESVTFTTNGTHTAPSGKAYDEVTVDVPNIPVITGTIPLQSSAYGLTINAPSDIDFTQYNHIIAWIVPNNTEGVAWATENQCCVGASVTFPIHPNFSTTSVEINTDPEAGKRFQVGTYNYAIWHE